jgi:DNA primase
MTPYGEKAMAEELNGLRSAPEGDRNNSLNRAAYVLAQLIGKGHLEEAELVSELQAAGRSLGLEAREADQTIQSGIKKGRNVVRGPEPGETSPNSSGIYRGPKAPGTSGKPKPEPFHPEPPHGPPPDLWIEKASALVDWAHMNLMRQEAHEHPKFMLLKRGISEGAMKAGRLGWNPGKEGKDVFRPREAWGLPAELNETTGKPKKMWIPVGVVIPMMRDGVPWRVRVRRDKADPRYYVLPGSNMDCLFHWEDRRAYVIVESELDQVMIDHEADDMAAAMALGNSSRKPDARAWQSLRQAAVILNALDHDAGGIKQSKWWEEQLPQTRRWPVPVGKDPGDAYMEGVDIREWIRSGLPAGWRR